MSDDWLSKLALKYLGDANRWPEIYDTNQAAIEAAAREHPGPPVFGTSDHGHWIFPGTRLTIPGASCAPTTTPTPTAETTPAGGGVSDEQACTAVEGIPAVDPQSGDFFCGSYGTISVLEHPFSPGELDQLKFAADAVGCLGDLGGAASKWSKALSDKGKKVVEAILFVDGVAKLEGDLETLFEELETLDLEPSDKVQIVTKVKDNTSDHIANVVWDIAGLVSEVPGVACVKLFYNRAVAVGLIG